MADDDRGVLGNLPHSRPGTRSEKREDRRAGGPAGRRTARTPPAGQAAGAAPTGEERQAGADPVATVVRTVAGAAEAGVRVAGTAAGAILRRFPRP